MDIRNSEGFDSKKNIRLLGDAIVNGLEISGNAERVRTDSSVNGIYYDVGRGVLEGIRIESNAILRLGDDTNYDVTLEGVFLEKEIPYAVHDSLERVASGSGYKYEIPYGARGFAVSVSLREGDVLPIVRRGESLSVSSVFKKMLDSVESELKSDSKR